MPFTALAVLRQRVSAVRTHTCPPEIAPRDLERRRRNPAALCTWTPSNQTPARGGAQGVARRSRGEHPPGGGAAEPCLKAAARLGCQPGLGAAGRGPRTPIAVERGRSLPWATSGESSRRLCVCAAPPPATTPPPRRPSSGSSAPRSVVSTWRDRCASVPLPRATVRRGPHRSRRVPPRCTRAPRRGGLGRWRGMGRARARLAKPRERLTEVRNALFVARLRHARASARARRGAGAARAKGARLDPRFRVVGIAVERKRHGVLLRPHTGGRWRGGQRGEWRGSARPDKWRAGRGGRRGKGGRGHLFLSTG